MDVFNTTLHDLCGLRTLLHDLYLNTKIKDYFLLYKEVVNNIEQMRKCPQLTREQMSASYTRTYKIQEHRMHIISYENHIKF